MTWTSTSRAFGRDHASSGASDRGAIVRYPGPVPRGVRVSVQAIGHPQRGSEALIGELQGGPAFWGGNYVKVQTAWPKPAITDALGRFTIRGVGRDLGVQLMAEDSRFARQRIVVDTEGTAETKEITAALSRPRSSSAASPMATRENPCRTRPSRCGLIAADPPIRANTRRMRRGTSAQPVLDG